MASQDRDQGKGPPKPSRNRRVHRTGDTVWGRGSAEVSVTPEDRTTGSIPAVTAPLATSDLAASPDASVGPPNTQPTQVIGPDWISSQIHPQLQQNGGAYGTDTWPVAVPTVPAAGGLQTPAAALEPAWEPQPDEPEDVGSAPSLVRPYARTGGRTKPGRELDLEALVRTTVNGKEAVSSPLLSPEHISVIDLCGGTVSVAEIAAKLAVPVGVARVIIADMVDLGLVEIMKTSAALGDERDPAFLRRVLSGLQRL